MKRVFISTGEVSGDLQASLLVRGLYEQATARGIELEVSALGGPRMAAAGAKILADTSPIGSIGLLEALPYILPTFKVQRQAKAFLKANPPDMAVLVDYLGPNLSLGNFIRKTFPHVPIWYYIAPQEWVWSMGDRNTNQLAGLVDCILSIFPEEARYYREKGATVKWVGHPLLDHLAQAPKRNEARQRLGIADDETAIALIPASRQQEIKYLMPTIFQAAKDLQTRLSQQNQSVKFLIPLSLEKYRGAITKAVSQFELNAEILGRGEIEGIGLPVDDLGNQPSIACLAGADLAITKSGTVNLEAALLNVPQAVVYRVSPITAWIARYILKFSIPFMSIVNLVEMQRVVPEFLQEAATPEAIAQEAWQLLQGQERQTVLEDYTSLRRALGDGGACKRAADAILDAL
ncbi:MAG: lipid-A-disaccharide synthase [Cyanobacteria bacterium P01_D01_bin.73]